VATVLIRSGTLKQGNFLAKKGADRKKEHHHPLNLAINFRNKYPSKLRIAGNHGERSRLRLGVSRKLMLLAEKNSKKLCASGYIALCCRSY
jgi:hypothetical protein